METEEGIVAVESAPEAAVPEFAEGGDDAVADEKVVKSKKVKEPKVKKPAGPRKPSSHPSYLEMITDAIVTLKEKGGSSVPAIAKFNEEKHKQLPSNFRKKLSLHLKNLTAAQRLVKVKNSFKLPTATSRTLAPPKATAALLKAKKPTKNKDAVKPKSTAKPKKETKAKPAAAKPKSVAAKPMPKPKATAVASTAKTKTPAIAKPKAVAVKGKPKSAPAAKPKPVASKAKPAPRPKPKERPTKVARTTTQSSPGKKAVTASKKAAPAAKKASPAKAKAKAKAVVKSPARRASARRANK